MSSNMAENTSHKIPQGKERKDDKDPSHGIRNPHMGMTETSHWK